MSALIPQALGDTHLVEAVVLHWKFSVAKRGSKPSKGAAALRAVYITAGLPHHAYLRPFNNLSPLIG